jgi:hypothetical protein
VLRAFLARSRCLCHTPQSVSEERLDSAVTLPLPGTRSGAKTRPEPPSRPCSIDESFARTLVAEWHTL